MSSTTEGTVPYLSDTEMCREEFKKLEKHILQLEEAAAKKDKQISQLTSRMREYEMGEYGLAEAVNEIKDCRRIIRARDREIESLTDEINVLKLQVSELKEEVAKQAPKSAELTSFIDNNYFSATNESRKKETKINESVHVNKTSQCKFSMFPAQYLEDFYATQLQNENLRLELSSVCKEAIELSVQHQNLYSQEQRNNEISIHRLQPNLTNLENSAKNKKIIMNALDGYTIEQSFKSVDDCYKAILHHIRNEDAEVQEIFHDLARQINVLKNNEMVLIRRYMILSDRESSLRRENIKLRKAVHINWRKRSDNCNSMETELGNEISTKHLSSEDTCLLKKLTGQSETNCTDAVCRANTTKLINIVMKLLAEIPLLRKLLEISHHQTQAVEAMCFAQEVEMKSLRDQFTLFQAQSDEKMLLGKLAMKVLQLQFNQAACIYELNKYKSNQQTLQDWYSTLKGEYEENGKRFAALYLGAQDKVKHLREVIKDVCQRCNEALSTYLSPDYKLL